MVQHELLFFVFKNKYYEESIKKQSRCMNCTIFLFCGKDSSSKQFEQVPFRILVRAFLLRHPDQHRYYTRSTSGNLFHHIQSADRYQYQYVMQNCFYQFQLEMMILIVIFWIVVFIIALHYINISNFPQFAPGLDQHRLQLLSHVRHHYCYLYYRIVILQSIGRVTGTVAWKKPESFVPHTNQFNLIRKVGQINTIIIIQQIKLKS